MIHEDQALLSCGFGIISLDLVKAEISSTYFIGDDGEQLEVFETEIFRHDSIFAATAKGVRKAFLRHPNLENYRFWETVEAQPTPFEAYTHLAYHEGHNGFRRGTYGKKKWLQRVAWKVQTRAKSYTDQLASCEKEFEKPGPCCLWPF